MLDQEDVWRREKRLEELINTQGKRGQRRHLQYLHKHYNKLVQPQNGQKKAEQSDALNQDSIASAGDGGSIEQDYMDSLYQSKTSLATKEPAKTTNDSLQHEQEKNTQD